MRVIAPDENFCRHFCPHGRAANFCYPALSHLEFNSIKNSTSLRFSPTIEARAPANGVGRATRVVQDDAPGRRVSTESSGSEVSIPPTTT